MGWNGTEGRARAPGEPSRRRAGAGMHWQMMQVPRHFANGPGIFAIPLAVVWERCVNIASFVECKTAKQAGRLGY